MLRAGDIVQELQRTSTEKLVQTASQQRPQTGFKSGASNSRFSEDSFGIRNYSYNNTRSTGMYDDDELVSVSRMTQRTSSNIKRCEDTENWKLNEVIIFFN
jgi:hypothetical protein